MGQQADSGRNASLDEKKSRAAGRRKQQAAPGRAAIKDAQKPLPAKGHTGGAYGKEGKANRKGGVASQGAGGGGGSPMRARDANASGASGKVPKVGKKTTGRT